jgi:opacity protein-like surface antigen
MRVTAIKLLLGASAALAMLTAAQAAQAQDYQDSAYVHGHPVAPEAYDTQGNPNYGFGPRVTPGPDDVVSGNRVIGRDPDPFIRGEILRHYDSGWPD